MLGQSWIAALLVIQEALENDMKHQMKISKHIYACDGNIKSTIIYFYVLNPPLYSAKSHSDFGVVIQSHYKYQLLLK